MECIGWALLAFHANWLMLSFQGEYLSATTELLKCITFCPRIKHQIIIANTRPTVISFMFWVLYKNMALFSRTSSHCVITHQYFLTYFLYSSYIYIAFTSHSVCVFIFIQLNSFVSPPFFPPVFLSSPYHTFSTFKGRFYEYPCFNSDQQALHDCIFTNEVLYFRSISSVFII